MWFLTIYAFVALPFCIGKQNDKEIDFIACRNGEYIYVQVAYYYRQTKW